MKTNQLTTLLAELGLTHEQSSIYVLLLTEGSLPAKEIAKDQGIIVNSVYRATDALIAMGLVAELDVSPKQFQAIPPSIGIALLAEEKTNQYKLLSESLIAQLPTKVNPNRLNMEILTGRAELFDYFVSLAKDVTREILVISIGEPVPESIWDITRTSVDNGVSAKFIFHKHDKANIMLYKRWQVMGVNVRYLPGEGYHLNIFDHSAAILSASNPKQSKERAGVVIYNEAIIEMLRTYFLQQWKIAKIV